MTIHNLLNFAKVSQFQASVIAFLINLKSDKSIIDNLSHVFQSLDKDKNGRLSKQEIIEAIEANQMD